MSPDPPSGWSTGLLATLTAIFATFVPGEEERARRHAHLAAETLSAAVDPGEVRLLKVALRGLEIPASNLALAGAWGRFSSMDVGRRERVLLAWSRHPIPRLRTAYQALKRLALFLAFGDGGEDDARPANPFWERIGYEPMPVAEAAAPSIRPLGVERRGEPLELAADVVIVGSGAGGGICAARLAETGLRPLVIEAGPYVAEPRMPRVEAAAFRDLYLDRGTTSTSDLGVMILAGHGLGGGTTINWTTAIAPPDWLRESWATTHGLGGFDGPQTEADIDRLRTELDLRPPTIIPPKDRVILDGAAALGWEAGPTERNAGPCTECGACGFGCPGGAKRSGLRAHLADAAARGARFLVDAKVERVEMAGSAVAGVSGTLRSPEGETPFRVRSPLVVVAAGALRTPLILQRSGVPHPEIGRHLRLHPTVAIAVRMPQPVDMWKGPTQAARSLQFWRPGPADGVGIGGAHGGFVIESAPAHPGLIAAAQPWEGGAAELDAMEGSRFSAPLIGIVRDHGAGRVRSSRGGWPRIEYRLDDRDGATARRALIEMARMARAAGAVEIVALATPGLRWRATDGPPAFDAFCKGLGRVSVAPNRASLFSAHQMGSARAGADPRRHPCDPDGRVRVDTRGSIQRGLYVGDASLFPTAAGVNPMLTVMAMAERTARALLADRAG